MKKVAIIILAFGAICAKAQNKPQVLEEYTQAPKVLEDYKTFERKAPELLISAKDLERKSNKQIDEALKTLSEDEKKEIKKAISRIKTMKKKLAELERLKQSMAITDPNLVSLPDFFHQSHNSLYCNGIEITDAGQMFDEGKTFLFLKFITPIGNRNNIPESFLNKDMRASFAVYTRQGKEVAFYQPYAFTEGMRLNQKTEYKAKWTIALDEGSILNDIKCAKRRHEGWLLNTNGQYESFPD